MITNPVQNTTLKSVETELKCERPCQILRNGHNTTSDGATREDRPGVV